VWVLLAVLVAATVFGGLRAVRDGGFRPARHDGFRPARVDPGPLTGTELEESLGERATLLQFSSAFCAPCRATRAVLKDVAGMVPGVTHLEVDAEHHLDLVRRLGIVRTPTTLVLDGRGRESTRATGAPSKQDVVAALGRAIEV